MGADDAKPEPRPARPLPASHQHGHLGTGRRAAVRPVPDHRHPLGQGLARAWPAGPQAAREPARPGCQAGPARLLPAGPGRGQAGHHLARRWRCCWRRSAASPPPCPPSGGSTRSRGSPSNVWPAPSARMLLVGASGLHQRIRSQACAWPRWVPHGSGLIKTAASSATFLTRLPRRRFDRCAISPSPSQISSPAARLGRHPIFSSQAGWGT